MITVNGNFESIIGTGSGYVTATLAGFGTNVPIVGGTGVIVQPSTTSNVGSNFTLSLFANDAITPAGTYYTLSFYTADGKLVSSANYQFGGSNTYDLSSTAPVQVVAPPAIWSTGLGNPNGVVSANVGAIYTRLDGGAGSTLYVKESGSGNTGWVAK